MPANLDLEAVIVESKFGILRDRVIVGGRDFAFNAAGTGGATLQAPVAESAVFCMMAGAIRSRSSRRAAPSRFDSDGVTRRSPGADASTEWARCSAIE